MKETNCRHKTPDFEIDLLCQLDERAISYIESYRHNKNEKTKYIVFKAALVMDIIQSKIELSHLHFGQDLKEVDNYIYYKYTQHFRTNYAECQRNTLCVTYFFFIASSLNAFILRCIAL